MLDTPYPELDELLTLVGEAGRRLSEIEASEGGAGNISIYIGWLVDVRRRFPIVETIELPEAVPELAGSTFVVTGSGRRLREIIDDPAANLGWVAVDEGGQTGRLYTSPRRLFARLTSEFNSHLAVHHDQVIRSRTNFHAVVHAQPRHLTYLTHIPRYQYEPYLNRHLLRWQPELICLLTRFPVLDLYPRSSNSPSPSFLDTTPGSFSLRCRFLGSATSPGAPASSAPPEPITP